MSSALVRPSLAQVRSVLGDPVFTQGSQVLVDFESGARLVRSARLAGWEVRGLHRFRALVPTQSVPVVVALTVPLRQCSLQVAAMAFEWDALLRSGVSLPCVPVSPATVRDGLGGVQMVEALPFPGLPPFPAPGVDQVFATVLCESVLVRLRAGGFAEPAPVFSEEALVLAVLLEDLLRSWSAEFLGGSTVYPLVGLVLRRPELLATARALAGV